jgi:hypothetical protein
VVQSVVGKSLSLVMTQWVRHLAEARVNHPAETQKQYWRISLHYPFLDNLITNLNHVFLNRKTASMDFDRQEFLKIVQDLPFVS